MSILDKSTLLEFRNTNRSLNESLEQHLNESKAGKIIVFLSHKHDERAELESAIRFLKSRGVSVYVDWQDEGMPKMTSGKTAQRIKLKIKECQKFIFLATEAAISSKWCNWELGFGDALKYIRNMALFPIRNDFNNYSGNEYLQIYPRIEYVPANTVSRKMGGYFNSGYYIVSPANENGESIYTEIEKWLVANIS